MPCLLRCTASLLAALMFLSPTADLLANEANLYSQVTTETWGEDGMVTTYAYDDNGSVTNKLVLSAGGQTNENHHFTYNLENRLVTASSYVYNQEGIRARSASSTTVNGGLVDAGTNIFLVDPFNPTGHAQILEELPDVGVAPTVSYTIGDDVISQSSHTPILTTSYTTVTVPRVN